MSAVESMSLFIVTLLCFQSLAKSRGNTIRRNFATKSRYPVYDDDDIVNNVPEGCTPLHLNMVLRHGTRYPGMKDIEGMSELADYINQFHNKETRIRDMKLPWVNRFKYGEKYLAEVGAEELYNISKRIRRKYQSLFLPKYSGEEHYFVSTMTPRASQSASAFAFGLFEGTTFANSENVLVHVIKAFGTETVCTIFAEHQKVFHFFFFRDLALCTKPRTPWWLLKAHAFV